ncbi:MAG: DUF2723 domain-containing protein, partial [Candidatus Eisenbacteria bacterium]|nr:DUF2723 domain-containing protein [Candidatus Eisenbacteria bacterium]
MQQSERNDSSSLPIVVLGFCVPLAAYLFTLVWEPAWGDPAELSLQAWRFGVVHPAGAPAHTLLAGVLARFGPEPAIATNLFSALCTAIASALVGLSVHGLTGRRTPGVLAAWSFA